MRKQIKFILLILVVALAFSGCVPAVNQMYRIPKRSNSATQLQTAIDKAMTDLSYCAPVSGNNLQVVQQADLDGDGDNEYLLFAQSATNFPLRLLILDEKDGVFYQAESIICAGFAFDTVVYAQLDDNPGSEIIFGCRISDQLQGTVYAYSFDTSLQSTLLTSTAYVDFLTADLDKDSNDELLILKRSESSGTVEFYKAEDDALRCLSTLETSGAMANIEQIATGKIHGDMPAVFVTFTDDEATVITDVYIYDGVKFTNVALSSGDIVGTRALSNNDTYAIDIDGDGVIELPYVMPMMPMGDRTIEDGQYLIRWYTITADGEMIIKSFTFHNLVDGWFLDLSNDWASQLTVVTQNLESVFYVWDDEFENATKVMTILPVDSENQTSNSQINQHVVYINDMFRYIAKLENDAVDFGITPEYVINSFHIIK